MKWEIKKNKIDMDYQKLLQKYQVVYTAAYALPLTVLGIFLSSGISINSFFFGVIGGMTIYLILERIKINAENRLDFLRERVNAL